MEITELMVGDWVKIKHTRRNIQVRALNCGVGFRNDLGTLTYVSAKELEPIKITPKFLKLNGFEENFNAEGERYCRLYLEESKNDIIFWFDKSGHCKQSIIYENQSYTAIGHDLKTIHELQHALKLCGIDKEFITNK